ncbi:MAG: TIM barrel protein [Phycisphaeraceae bacterium]
MWTLSAFTDEAATDIDGQIRAAAAGHLKTIDLRNLDGFNISELPLDHAKQVKEKLDAAGLSVGMFGSPIGKIDITQDFAIDQKKLDTLGKLADIFSCRKVRIFSYFNSKDDATKAKPMYAWAAEALRRLGALKEQAAKLNLCLYHENEHIIFGDKVWQNETIARSLRDEGAPGSEGPGIHFRCIFDFDNYNQVGEDVWAAWQRLQPYTDAFHLKDSTKECTHVPIGTGNGRAADILADALKRGWTGHLANEPHLSRSPAIMATGPGGTADQKLADLSDFDCFLVGVRSGHEMLKGIKAPV